MKRIQVMQWHAAQVLIQDKPNERNVGGIIIYTTKQFKMQGKVFALNPSTIAEVPCSDYGVLHCFPCFSMCSINYACFIQVADQYWSYAFNCIHML